MLDDGGGFGLVPWELVLEPAARAVDCWHSVARLGIVGSHTPTPTGV
jgi:hypothetical protein